MKIITGHNNRTQKHWAVDADTLTMHMYVGVSENELDAERILVKKLLKEKIYSVCEYIIELQEGGDFSVPNLFGLPSDEFTFLTSPEEGED